MTTIVHAGQTYGLSGMLAAGDTLAAAPGDATRPGALITVRHKAVSNGTIVLGGATIAGATGATLSDSGTLTNNGLISIQGSSTGAGGTLNDTGMLANAGTLLVGSGSDSYGALLAIGLGATLTNSGRLVVEANLGTYRPGLASPGGRLIDSGLLINTGTMVLAGGSGENRYEFPAAAAVIAGTLENLGVITLRGGDGNGYGSYFGYGGGGTLDVAGLLTNAGTISVGATAPIFRGAAGGPGVLIDTGRLTNTGTIELQTSSGYYEDAQSLGGTLVLLGQLGNAGLLEIQGGKGYGQGYSEVSFGAMLQDQGMLTNTGTIDIDGRTPQPPGYFYDGSGATLLDIGVLTNMGLIKVGAGADAGNALLDVASGGSLDNAGRLVVAGGSVNNNDTGGTLQVNGSFVNGGTLLLQGGIGNTAASGVNDGAVATIDSAYARNLYGTIIVGGGAAYGYGGGDVGPGSGATLSIGGNFDNEGPIEVKAGGLAYRDIPGGAGVLIDTGTIFSFGPIDLQGGGATFYGNAYGATATVTDTGLLFNYDEIAVGAGVSTYGGGGTGAVLNVAGTLDNAGTMFVGGQHVSYHDRTSSAGRAIVSGYLSNENLIVLQSGAGGGQSGSLTITATGTFVDTGTIQGGGTLVNNGALHVTHTATIAASLVNQGEVQIAAGTILTIAGAVGAASGHGVFDLTAASTLTFAGSVDTHETVAFQGAGATLALGDATQFAGLIEGLGAGDTIDFTNLGVTAAHASGNGLDLGLANGGALDLHLAAPIAVGFSLHLTADAHGGTDLILLTPPGS